MFDKNTTFQKDLILNITISKIMTFILLPFLWRKDEMSGTIVPIAIISSHKRNFAVANCIIVSEINYTAEIY